VKITRKKFLKYFYKFLLIPLFAVAYFSADKQNKLNKNKKIFLPENIENGITFYDELIINKSNLGIKVFSSRCTHLGCKIENIQSNQLVCKCHGSKFTLDGKVIAGPAIKNLAELKIITDESGRKFVNYE